MSARPRTELAQACFAATAVAVAAGVVIQVVVAATADPGQFDSAWARVLNVFCYFTTLSNVIVGVTCAALALRPTRTGPVFTPARLTGVVAITITGVVYHLVLAQDADLHGWAVVSDALLHTVVPLLCVGGWLAFGPRAGTTGRAMAWTLAFPAAWTAATLVRGALTGFYPYPFIDVDRHGYGRVALNLAVITVLFLAVAGAAWLVARPRPGRPAGPAHDEPA